MAASGVYELTRFTALAAGDVLPAVDISDTTQSAHGSLLSITVTNFFASIPVPVAITSASAAALAVGLAGATNPAFKVDASTALQAAGLTVVGAVTGGTVAVVVRDSGTDANLSINAKGAGTIGIGSVSTGRVTITPATTITGALTQTGLATFNGGLTMGAATTLAAQAVTATTGTFSNAGATALTVGGSANASTGISVDAVSGTAGAWVQFKSSGVVKWLAGRGPATASDNYEIYDQAGSVLAFKIASGGGAVTVASGLTVTAGGILVSAGDLTLANASVLKNAATSLVGYDATNFIMNLGGATGVSGVGVPVRIVTRTAFDTAGATFNGEIMIDATNNRFCYYSGGNRYYLAGTLF